MTAPATRSAWASQPERGSPLLLRALLWLALRLGPTATWLLPPAVAWFLATAPGARAASRDYLGRVLGRPARLAEVARHFYSFAGAVLERVHLIIGRGAGFDIRIEGLEHVAEALKAGRGGVLLGAHLGSFEVLRGISHLAPVPVHPVMYRRNAGALTTLLDQLAPDLRESIIEIGEPGSMLRAREAVERGEMVGLLADRSPDGERVARVPFLGSTAAFPAGPFVLAAVLGAPVLLCFGLRLGPRRYLVRFQPFAERLVLDRASRQEDLRRWISRYAGAVEAVCRAHPFNWFNFFPFWEPGPHAQTAPSPRDAAAARPAAGGPGGGPARAA